MVDEGVCPTQSPTSSASTRRRGSVIGGPAGAGEGDGVATPAADTVAARGGDEAPAAAGNGAAATITGTGEDPAPTGADATTGAVAFAAGADGDRAGEDPAGGADSVVRGDATRVRNCAPTATPTASTPTTAAAAIAARGTARERRSPPRLRIAALTVETSTFLDRAENAAASARSHTRLITRGTPPL